MPLFCGIGSSLSLSLAPSSKGLGFEVSVCRAWGSSLRV